MAQGYENLSRRALIKLGKDFDQENDANLMHFLTEHNGEYESIRPIESAIERVDQIKNTLSDSSSIIKSTFIKQADKIIDSVIDALSSVPDMSELTIDTESDGF